MMKDHKHRQVFVGGVLKRSDDTQHRSILRGIARRAMLDRGLLPDFPPQAPGELDGIKDRGNDSILSLSAHPTNVHGTVFCNRPLKEDW